MSNAMNTKRSRCDSFNELHKCKKRVRFHKSCKMYDGLSPHSQMFEDLVSTRSLKPHFQVNELEIFSRMIRELIIRIYNAKIGESTSVLKFGGGKAYLVNRNDICWLLNLEKKITFAIYSKKMSPCGEVYR